ncbi:hypothetical protein GEMRC1_000636 [Eukaryota sp. GEM-RC1]
MPLVKEDTGSNRFIWIYHYNDGFDYFQNLETGHYFNRTGKTELGRDFITWGGLNDDGRYIEYTDGYIMIRDTDIVARHVPEMDDRLLQSNKKDGTKFTIQFESDDEY